MILQSKAWVINKNKLAEPWFAPDEIYYGETVGKVKSKALCDLDGHTDSWLKEPFTFLNVPLIRAKQFDKYIIGEVVKTVTDIEYDNRKAQRDADLLKIVTGNPDGMAYIIKGGMYYRPNNCGYTEFKSMAGIYPVADAARTVKSCSLGDNMRMILINKDEHNAMINERIEDLKTRIIP